MEEHCVRLTNLEQPSVLRHDLFEKWQDVTKTIAKRDEDILKIGEEVGEMMEAINANK